MESGAIEGFQQVFKYLQIAKTRKISLLIVEFEGGWGGVSGIGEISFPAPDLREASKTRLWDYYLAGDPPRGIDRAKLTDGRSR